MLSQTTGVKIAKYLLFSFNIIFWLAGIFFTILGSLFLTRIMKVFNDWIDLLSSNEPFLRTGAWILVILGLLLFTIGFCGLCGAIRQNTFLVTCYLVLLCATVGVEVGIAVFIGAKRKILEQKLEKQLDKIVKKSYSNEPTTQSTVDHIQQQFQCCGVFSRIDWSDSLWKLSSDATNKKAPDSCCKHMKDLETCHSNKDYFLEGCYSKSKEWIGKKFPMIVGAAATIAAVEIASLILSCVLWNALKSEER